MKAEETPQTSVSVNAEAYFERKADYIRGTFTVFYFIFGFVWVLTQHVLLLGNVFCIHVYLYTCVYINVAYWVKM